MEEIGSSGRTVLFVSHSIPAILRLCDRVLLLDGGALVADGKAHEVIARYMHSGLGSSAERHWTNPEEAPGDDVARLKSVRVSVDGEVTEEVDIRKPVDIELQYWHLPEQTELRPLGTLLFYDEDGVLLFISLDSNNVEWRTTRRRRGLVTATCSIPGNFFAEGRIFVHASVRSINPVVVHLLERDAVSFQVVDRSQVDGVRGEWVGDYPGVVRPMLEWTVDVQPIAGTERRLESRAGA
jgi:lipopolysaccharide transport system ATP-binding protein